MVQLLFFPAGLKDTITGETLCDPEKPVVLERMDFPDPVIKVAIEPKTKADVDKMSMGLIKLAQEDPSFHFSRDEETNQTVIEGMGELHLEIIVDRLKREFKVRGTMLDHCTQRLEVTSGPVVDSFD